MKKHIGEIQGVGTQVVIPGCKNEKGEEYKVINDVPIKELTTEQLTKIKSLYSSAKIFEVKSPNWNLYTSTPLSEQINITQLVDTSKLKKYGEEFCGSHEMHGSKTGMNFFINPNKNMWHCFRHNSGGDALSYLAIKEGICSCEDFAAGGVRLRGENFMKTIERAKELGLIELPKTEDIRINNLLGSTISQDRLRIITDEELSNLELEDIEWIIKDLIPRGGLVLIAGKSKTLKSFITTLMGFCVSYGLKFLGEYETSEGKWLYIDEENPKMMTKGRNELIRNGLNIPPTKEFGYILHGNIKVDKQGEVTKLIRFIEEFKPEVVVLDSLIRFLSASTDENSSTDISNIFTTLRQISIDYDVAFVIIHHMGKAGDKKGIDKVRGSTDIVNAVDCVLLFDRENTQSPYIDVSQEKNRFDREIEPFTIETIQDKDKKALFFKISKKEKPKDRATSAAELILEWLESKDWGGEKKEFETKEVLEKFEKKFDNKDEKNRKIVQAGLKKLVTDSKIDRMAKGKYEFIQAIDLDSDEE